MAGNKTKTRRFSYTNPIMFQGSYYPTAEWDIQSDTGEVNPATVFADANGSYYTLDNNGSAIPVMPFHNLDEVTVTAPKKQDVSANAFSRYLTMSNDNTQVNNLPHREYNTHLKENAERGAKEHALWEKEHPNLAAWGEAAGAIPFGVASIPLIAGTGQALLGTAAGQAVKSGVTKALANPLVELANNTIGLGFAGKGAYDVSQGNFTPETAMDLAGGVGLLASNFDMFNRLLTARKVRKPVRNPIIAASVEDVDLGLDGISNSNTSPEDIVLGIKEAFPLKGETEIPMKIKAEAAKKYTNFINSNEYQKRLQRAGLEDHWDYMKDLTNRQVNNNGYFPSHVKFEINGDSDVLGLSAVEPSSPNYGITLQEDLSKKEIDESIMHELSHWATGNAGTNDIVNSVKHPFKNDPDANFIGDIMRYNESITPNIDWDDILNNLPKNTPIDKVMEIQDTYNYLSRPTEKRARLMAIRQLAEDAGMTTDAFVDKYTMNNRIMPTAPMNLKQLGEILTVDTIKKGLNNFLSIAAPIGIAASRNKKQHE